MKICSLGRVRIYAGGLSAVQTEYSLGHMVLPDILIFKFYFILVVLEINPDVYDR